jgi:hypothetical protein
VKTSVRRRYRPVLFKSYLTCWPSAPASILNQSSADLTILNRFRHTKLRPGDSRRVDGCWEGSTQANRRHWLAYFLRRPTLMNPIAGMPEAAQSGFVDLYRMSRDCVGTGSVAHHRSRRCFACTPPVLSNCPKRRSRNVCSHADVGGKADVNAEESHCLHEYTAEGHPLFAYTIRRLKSPPRVASHLFLVII